MNSLFAVKCILDNCDFVSINFVEAYLYHTIKQVASIDITLDIMQRGAKYFQGNGNNQGQLQNYGYNYVTLATEIVMGLAIIKPNKLYFNRQTSDPSDFELGKT